MILKNDKREVAIKMLPEAFPRDKERLARFGREARLLASLNHPNIATIHDLEESARGTLTRLTLEFDNQIPVWTSVSRRLTFRSTRAGDGTFLAGF